MPERYGPWQTPTDIFYGWRHLGRWARVLDELQRQSHGRDALDWRCITSTARWSGRTGPARWQRRGSSTRRPAARAAGSPPRSKSAATTARDVSSFARAAAKPTTKHRRIDWTAVRSAASERAQAARAAASRPQPSHRHTRHDLHRRSIGSVIPQPKSQHPCALIDRPACARINQVERLVGRLKQCRRIAARRGQRTANCLAVLQIAAIML